MNIDEWFGQVRKKYASQMQCGKGCTACCHGLFDISLADVGGVVSGFSRLPDDLRQQVHARAVNLQNVVRKVAPGLSTPSLFDEDDPRIDAVVEAATGAPCPFLGEAGECLIYEHRPLACRLEGVPMVDKHEGLFADWCELNFKEGLPKTVEYDLSLDYNQIDAAQDRESAEVAVRFGLPDQRLVTFIPSVIAEYDNFWKEH